MQQPEVLKDKLRENEKLMKEMSLTWEEKLTITGQTQEDRRQALEKLGISVQSSGIKVEKNKCFLVNLNSDPSLNEMLVYYLKEKTMVGRTGSNQDPDIQLSGVGIQVFDKIFVYEICQLFVDYFFNASRMNIVKSTLTNMTGLSHLFPMLEPELVSMEKKFPIQPY